MKNFLSKLVRVGGMLICIGVMLTIVSCSPEGRKLKERPSEIIITGAQAEVFQKIMADFPEYQSVKTKQPMLFEASSEKRIVLLNESDVYVTFISEGAGYENTFGWYSYTPSTKPSTASSLKLNVLFPTVSDRVLKQGDMLKLGDKKFPAGTVIGFFLIIKGWQHGTINYDNETFYTDQNFNPDQQQQHVLFKQKDLGQIVLTFEDQLVSGQSDEDYNDIIFTVTDNRLNKEVSNIDLKGVVQL
jgi:uncharacterized protein DUF4114